jgi:hypothetical protein
MHGVALFEALEHGISGCLLLDDYFEIRMQTIQLHPAQSLDRAAELLKIFNLLSLKV